jgi:hypothetical protein
MPDGDVRFEARAKTSEVKEGAAGYGDLTVARRVAEAVKARGFCDCGCWIGRLGLNEWC